LVHRVDPVYPVLAVSAGLEGTVILEAIVDRDGRVESLRVLRSQGVLDRAAPMRSGSGAIRRCC
jgi:TonB family protein